MSRVSPRLAGLGILAAVLAVARQELGGTNSSTYIRAKNALNIEPDHEDHFHIRIY